MYMMFMHLYRQLISIKINLLFGFVVFTQIETRNAQRISDEIETTPEKKKKNRKK